MLSPEETLAVGRLIARRKAPYFRALLLSFILVEAPGLGTVGCTVKGHFLWDRKFIARMNPEEMAFLWVHECQHRLLKHGERRGHRDPKKWNRAGDRTINPSCIDMGFTPPHEFPPLMPEQIGAARGLTADEYYNLEPDEDGEGEGGDKPSTGQGHCGSCAGRPVPGEPEEGGRSEQEMARAEREVAQEIKDHQRSNGVGSVPGNLARWADDILKPARIPWRQKLSRVIRGAVAWQAGAVDFRYDGPGRRQAGLGFGPGVAIMPRLRAPLPSIEIGVDTSGSMGPSEMTDVLREANGVVKATGAPAIFTSFDSQIAASGEIRRIEDAIALCKGGGGTDFRPFFANLQKRRPRPSVAICATDGCGPAPELPPPGVATIWLLVGSYRQKPCSWGTVVEVIPDGQDSKLDD